MDSESLDSCIQSTLAALYPPFEATGGTVLCQVLDVVESSFCGDGLHYLIDFLVPAKHILQSIQQDACFPYCGFLFRHEGWPLCVHEKIIIQLSSLDRRVLKPSDFYLQVAASPKTPPRVTLKCLSVSGQHEDELEISEIAYASLFSMAWLDSINQERAGNGRAPLEHCLLAADNDIFRVPWEDVVHPEFISRSPQATQSGLVHGRMQDIGDAEDQKRTLEAQNGLLIDTSMVPMVPFSGVQLLPAVEQRSKNSSGRSSAADDSEGEYVELADITLPRFSPQKGSLTQSISTNYRNLHKSQTMGPLRSKVNALQDSVRNSTCPQSMVCAMLIEENLNEPFRPHSQQKEVVDGKLASTEGTAHAACLPEHVPESVSDHSDCDNAALFDSKPNITSPDTATGNELHHLPVCCPKQLAKQCVIVDSEGGVSKPGVERRVETNRDRISPNVGLLSSSILSECQGDDVQITANEKLGSLHQWNDYSAQSNLGEPLDQPFSDIVEAKFGRNSPCSFNVEEVKPGSATPVGEQVDWAIVPAQSAESQVTARHPVEARTKPGEEVIESNKETVERELKVGREKQDERDDQTEAKGVNVSDNGTEGDSCESEAQGVAVDVVEEGKTPQTGLVDSTPDSGTTVKTAETGTSLGTGIPQKSHNKETDAEITRAGSKGTGDAGNLGCGLVEVEQVVCTDPEVEALPRVFEVFANGPVMNVGSVPGQTGINSETDAAVEGGFTPAVQMEEEINKSEEDGMTDPRLLDEITSSGNGTQLDADMESHQQQELIQTSDSVSTIPTEDSSTVKDQDHLPLSPSPARTQPRLTELHNINPDILKSGVLCLPGTRDKAGRALVTMTTRNTAWLNPDCNCSELARIMTYFCTVLRQEVRVRGLTVLVDARRCSPVPALFKTFTILQEDVPGCIHSVLVLSDRDLALRTEKPITVQLELLNSLKSLQKYIDVSQLPAEFDGTFQFSHDSWICFRMRVEQLTNHCEDAKNLLQSTISSLESSVLPPTAEEAQLLLCKYKDLMRNVLEDNRLVRLQLEGGAALSRLRKEDTSVCLTEDYRDAIDSVGSLYDQVDELVHRLVMLSNKCTQELEFVMDFKSLEDGFNEVSQWIDAVGEKRLQTLVELEDSLEQLRSKQADFKDFYVAAYEHCKSGEALLKRLERWEDVSSPELQVYEVKVHAFWVHLHDFSQRVEDTKEKIDKTVRLYEFFDKAYEWALEGMRHLACVSMEDCSAPEKCSGVISCLENYRSQHVPIPDARFQEMKDLAVELKNEQGLKQWKFAWSKCQETKQMFEKKLEVALRTRNSGTPQERSSSLSFSCRKAFSSGWVRERLSSTPCKSTSTRLDSRESPRTPTGIPAHVENRISYSTPLTSHRLTRSASSDENPYPACSTHAPSPSSSSLTEAKRRVLRKTQSFDAAGSEIDVRYGTCQRTLSEPGRRGNTGVFIKGLEVSSTEVSDRPYSPRLAPAHNWVRQDPHLTGSPVLEPRAKGSKLRHIVDEMVTTEREYVRSLRYIIDHYFPEMERPDLPQDLRGKRSVIFGNLEKLVDFHSQYFLKELESCCNHPLRVSHCFLRHQDQFGLYALYSKNKPKSDLLLASHGNSFFRHKQLELEDKMDLASYLLKPIQRMSKYALLLKDLIKEVNEAQEQELSNLRAATEMVKFQLRHGNDLLAMDAIRDCDVNLKEQGQLVRQDEFTIWYGRKKCQRHVFLFEDLVLFSKPKRLEGGLDVYIYKHSFKTADVGMTETSGENGLRFEIWFRRRTSKNQAYILQAATADIKQAWTSDIARILWQQATRNKEIRMQEMVSMGVGNKPFLDIKPSDAAINDRAIDYIMKGRGARTRASIAVSLFDHSNPFKRAAVSAPANGPPAAGTPLSSSLLGPLNLHMYSSQTLLSGERPLIGPCIEEDELEHETSSQPSMTTESSGSSSHCLSGSGSSGSDSGCVSSHLPEVLTEEPHSPCQNPCYCINSPTEQKTSFNSQYISSKGAQVLGPSTIV